MTESKSSLTNSSESDEQDTAVNTTDKTSQVSSNTPARHDKGHESVTPETRSDVLERDGYRCQVCGRGGPERGELATLHVHHIERDPDRIDENAMENLTTLCRSCHSWVHQQTPPTDAPVKLTEADQDMLLPQDIEILRYLADEGPARTGHIRDELTADLSLTAVRERLSVLMGLDNMVESRDRQIVDKDLDTGEWGLIEQIENSARGHIPDDPRILLQRIEDEQVRQALERGCDRHAIVEILDISRRTTFHKQKRAYAHDFPLDAFRRSGSGGQHPAGDTASGMSDHVDDDSSSDDQQQQLDSVIGGADHSSQSNPVESVESKQSSQDDMSGETTPDEDQVAVREQLQTAITALQRINTEL